MIRRRLSRKTPARAALLMLISAVPVLGGCASSSDDSPGKASTDWSCSTYLKQPISDRREAVTHAASQLGVKHTPDLVSRADSQCEAEPRRLFELVVNGLGKDSGASGGGQLPGGSDDVYDQSGFAALSSGRFSGESSQGKPVELLVSDSGRQVRKATVTYSATCSTGAPENNRFSVADRGIGASGHFASSGTYQVDEGTLVGATLTSSISGDFAANGQSVTGVMSTEITRADGATCSTGRVDYSLTRTP